MLSNLDCQMVVICAKSQVKVPECNMSHLLPIGAEYHCHVAEKIDEDCVEDSGDTSTFDERACHGNCTYYYGATSGV
ncbi:hypothetical protein DPMN_089332 [Dreissena polymorpha]|uniref:Uncharacterized protein n=1 Tax=Dreissena polymorpha TaxID=45954 RepID=A0A9D4QYR4_DREPO|nr:hypothetical protein DPMN_089332 [Dreissena polymorpha]